MRRFLARPRCRRGIARVAASALLVVLLAGCSAADDGTRVRDRDGAGVEFEDAT